MRVRCRLVALVRSHSFVDVDVRSLALAHMVCVGRPRSHSFVDVGVCSPRTRSLARMHARSHRACCLCMHMYMYISVRILNPPRSVIIHEYSLSLVQSCFVRVIFGRTSYTSLLLVHTSNTRCCRWILRLVGPVVRSVARPNSLTHWYSSLLVDSIVHKLPEFRVRARLDGCPSSLDTSSLERVTLGRK